MLDTMRANNGAGLAAIQIGVLQRVVVFELEHNPRYPDAEPVPLTVLVNPKIELLGDERESGWEGCLSVPGLRGLVPRHRRLRYLGLRRAGPADRPDGQRFPRPCRAARVRSLGRHSLSAAHRGYDLVRFSGRAPRERRAATGGRGGGLRRVPDRRSLAVVSLPCYNGRVCDCPVSPAAERWGDYERTRVVASPDPSSWSSRRRVAGRLCATDERAVVRRRAHSSMRRA